jgi:CMP-N-acetylneuraminic acid synthetase
MVKEAIAVIPSRGGSKRIPQKNIIEFMGKPMLAWTLEAAMKSKLFDRVFVSTEDEEIAFVAKSLGAEIPFLRSEKYADDYSEVSAVTCWCLEQMKDRFEEEYQTVVQLMPNCPLRNETHILDAYQFFTSQRSIFQISAFRYGWMNPWWAATLDAQNHPQRIFPEAYNARSQDLPPLYCPSGAIWIARTKELLAKRSFYGVDCQFHIIDWRAAIDIDDLDDLEMAKSIAKQMASGSETVARKSQLFS